MLDAASLGRPAINLEIAQQDEWMAAVCNVTRLGDLLHFWQLFKACGNNYLPKSPTFWPIFVKLLKSFIFLVKSFLGNFHRYLSTFYWSHCLRCPCSTRKCTAFHLVWILVFLLRYWRLRRLHQRDHLRDPNLSGSGTKLHSVKLLLGPGKKVESLTVSSFHVGRS